MMPAVISLLLPILTVLLCLAIAITIIAITILSPVLTEFGPYTSRQHTEYALVSTLVATLLTTAIASRIRQLWIRYVDLQLAEYTTRPHLDVLNHRWRTALGLAGPLETLKHGWVFLSYLITGLITTSIVASITPTPGTKVVTYSPTIPNDEPNICVGGDIFDSLNYWNTSAGKEFGVNAITYACPLGSGLTVIGSINTINPTSYAYIDKGVAVQSSALAAPISIYDAGREFGTNVVALTDQYGTNVISTQQCVPIMLKNPYSCRTGGVINSTNLAASLVVTSEDGSCTVGADQNAFVSQSDMVKGYCLHGSIGQGTVLFAAAGSSAIILAQTVGDQNWNQISDLGTYSVECTIDATDVFDWRYVQLSLQNNSQSGFNRILYSPPLPESLCIADYVPSTGFNILAALAATASYESLRENVGEDGFFQSIAEAATSSNFSGPRTGPWAFAQSTNALEDVLGLMAALIVSRNSYNTTGVISSGFALVEVTRAGSGGLYGVAFVIPPLIAALVLVSLIIRTWKADETALQTSSLKDLLETDTGDLRESGQFGGTRPERRQDIELTNNAKGGNAVAASLLGRPESGYVLTHEDRGFD